MTERTKAELLHEADNAAAKVKTLERLLKNATLTRADRKWLKRQISGLMKDERRLRALAAQKSETSTP